MKYKIPLTKPELSKSDFEEISKCFNSTWISSKSPWVEDFEELFAKEVSGTKYAVSVNSGTSALFLSLKALGIGRGDEVIIPSFTMIATINAISLAGARAVLVDSMSRKDWNISTDLIEKKVTQKTKAIIPVHIYGYICEMDKIKKIAKKNKLFVISDAAEAMGSTYKGSVAGSLSDISCFSLYANKIITTGNGGMVATDNKNLAKEIKRLRFFDFGSTAHFEHEIIGYNMVLSGLSASLGLSQVKKFNKYLKKRRQVYNWYKKYLEGHGSFGFIDPDSNNEPNYWFPALVFEKTKDKERVKKYLKEKGIETRNFFMPIHMQKAYGGVFKGEKYKNAEYFYKRGLLLPSYYKLKHIDVEKISALIKNFLTILIHK